MADMVKAAALLATIVVVVVAVAWRRSRERAAEARRSALLRQRLITRAKAGMAPGHPEDITDPSDAEMAAHGALFVQVAVAFVPVAQELGLIQVIHPDESGDQR